MSFFDGDSAIRFSYLFKKTDEVPSLNLHGKGFNGRGAILILR